MVTAPRPPIDHVVYSFALALVAVVGIVILAVIEHPIPATLDVIAGGSAMSGAALSRRSPGG